MELKNLDNSMIPSPLDEHEHLPDTAFYNDWGLPRQKLVDIRADKEAEKHEKSNEKKYESPNFGTFNGVYMRCILSILSAVYYLRLGWVVGNCGLVMALVLILVSGVATILTTLSLSAIVSNGLVRGGGVYYFISRSLGADWGGTIGVIFSFATTFSAVLHSFSFVDVVQAWHGGYITNGGKWDHEIIAISLIFILLLIICTSLKVECYMEYCLSALIGVAMIGFFFGLLNKNTPRWKVSNLKNNLWASYLPGENFFTVFAVFFPGCTGIMAGANISGDLADPQKSIPVGTIGAIITTTLLNMITAIILASAATKNVLLTDTTIMCDMSLWGPLVYLGIIGAAVSSASAALIGGPKTFQSLCEDKILPKVFDFFAVGKASSNDPVRGFILGFLIVAVSCFIFKDLNTVGTILTMFFLISFALICAACLVGSMSRSPSWRPSWKYHHPILDVLGAALMIIGMFLINWVFSLATVGACLAILAYFHWGVTNANNWGEFPISLLFTDTVSKLEKLGGIQDNVKTYRPQIEYVIDAERESSVEKSIINMLPFNQVIDKSYSIMGISCLGILSDEQKDTINNAGFTHYWGSIDADLCSRLIANAVGYGKVKPNIIATHFSTSPRFFSLVCAAIDSSMGVLISRNFDTFDINVENHFPLDIWWLADDGGLTLLVGYLLSTHSAWKKCDIRLFTILPDGREITDVQVKLSKLLHLFRIKAQILVVKGMGELPKEDMYAQWNDCKIQAQNDTDTKAVNKFLKLREFLMKYSDNSSLIICTIPIPKVNVTPELWTSLMGFVSDSMPPFIWSRGNNENVITFSA